jgi:hypothetical protein
MLREWLVISCGKTGIRSTWMNLSSSRRRTRFAPNVLGPQANADYDIGSWTYFPLLIQRRISPPLNAICLNITLCFNPLNSLIRCFRIFLSHVHLTRTILLPFHPGCTHYLFSFATPFLRSCDYLSSSSRLFSICRFILWLEWALGLGMKKRRRKPKTRSFLRCCCAS